MPDTKFTPARLKEHLRRWLAVYAIALAACLALTSLLWTVTRPRVPARQTILVYLADTWSNAEPLNAMAPELLAKVQADAPDIRALGFESLMYADSGQDYTSNMLLMTRLAANEGDAFLASAAAMEALAQAGAAMPLEDAVADGWLADFGLEPYYATVTDEETGATRTFLAGLRLDAVDGLAALGAFDNRGAFLTLPVSGENPREAMLAMEYLLEALREVPHGTDGTE